MAELRVTRYDAMDCAITVDGINITGLAEDMVTGEKSEDYFTPSVGAQGDVVKNIINNSLGEITVVVQPTCPQKGSLMALANREDTFPIWVINEKLGEEFGGAKANLLHAPSISRAAEAEDLEFVFQVYDYTVKMVDSE